MAKKKKPPRTSILNSKINAIKRRLAEMRDYKKILAQDGLEPDREDKERESKLIVQLLRHEKELAAIEGNGKPPAKKKKVRRKT